MRLAITSPRLLGVAAAIALTAVPLAAAGAKAPAASTAAPLTLAPRAVTAAGPQPLTPTGIRRAYALPARGASGQTIAAISAYDDPHAAADLAAYDKRFSLPACTAANHCFTKLNQQGKAAPLPGSDVTGGTWITESAVGIELAHGICQSCRVLLVEANSDSDSDFSAAVATAASAGATVITTTFTPPELPDDGALSPDYSSAHGVVVAATGDPIAGSYGYSGNLNFPSALSSVIAVGGTTLKSSASGGYGSETAWKGTVSGCSLYSPAPAWQATLAKAAGCGSQRAVADLAAMAQPGAIVHITGSGQSGGPWFVVGGTSLAAPIVGGVIGLAGSAGPREPQMLYARAQADPQAFHDIRTGANTQPCRSLICQAGRGWDGPTGLGSPNGLEGFLPGGPKVNARHPRLGISTGQAQLRASRRWTVRLAVTNANPFTVTGSLVLRRTATGHGQQGLLGSATFRRGSLAGGGVTITIGTSYRGLIRRAHMLDVWALASVHGATGRTVTVKRKLLLLAP